VQENEIVTDLLQRAEAIAIDRDSGASELTARLLPLLDEALRRAPPLVVPIIRRVCEGQPAMAPLWHVCAAALDDGEHPGAFARMRQARERAPAALARVASAALVEDLSGVAQPLLLTLSFSGSVVEVLRAVQAIRPIRIVCGEGRPRYEGRRLAASLAAAGATVTLTTDAAVPAYLREAAAVVVGADAVAASFWINKVGTHGLAATAADRGVPVMVMATSDKALPARLASHWRLPLADPDEVWGDPPRAVRVENPYFEAVPAELATVVFTEVGRLTPDGFPAFAERGAERWVRLLDALSLP
jgi:translation initiation factor eIF-2B subunit delta